MSKDGNTWVAHFSKEQALRGAIASVSLSHSQHCSCIVCRGARGDKEAFGKLMDRHYLEIRDDG